MTLSKLIISATLVFSGQASHQSDEKDGYETPTSSSSSEKGPQSSPRNINRMPATTSFEASSSPASTEANPPPTFADPMKESTVAALSIQLNELNTQIEAVSDNFEKEISIPIKYGNNGYVSATISNREVTILKKNGAETHILSEKIPNSYENAAAQIKAILKTFPKLSYDINPDPSNAEEIFRQLILSKVDLLLCNFQTYLIKQNSALLRKRLDDSEAEAAKSQRGLDDAKRVLDSNKKVLEYHTLEIERMRKIIQTGYEYDGNEYTDDTVDIFTSLDEMKGFSYDFVKDELIIMPLDGSNPRNVKGQAIMAEMTKLKNGSYGEPEDEDELNLFKVMVPDLIKYLKNKHAGKAHGDDPTCEICRQRPKPETQ